MKNITNSKTTDFEVEENYSSKTGVTGTLTAEYSDFILNIMDFRENPSDSKENKTVYNFYSPVFISGRVKKKGLFRESANPFLLVCWIRYIYR